MFNKQTTGFSLIELTISMVMIGLLATAIFHSKKLVETSQLNRLMGDFQEMESQMTKFFFIYNALPGDMPNAYNVFGEDCYHNAEICNGDGDGKIFWNYNSPFELTESIQLWKHLSLAKISQFNPNYEGPQDNPRSLPSQKTHGIGGINIPRSQVGGSYFIFYSNSTWTNTKRVINQNSLIYADQNIGRPSTNNISIEKAYLLDNKYDDGLPLSGSIWTANPNCRQANMNGELDYKLMSDKSLLCHLYYILDLF